MPREGRSLEVLPGTTLASVRHGQRPRFAKASPGVLAREQADKCMASGDWVER